MNHTFLNKKNKDNSIFKILDEITACLENIKIQLINISYKKKCYL